MVLFFAFCSCFTFLIKCIYFRDIKLSEQLVKKNSDIESAIREISLLLSSANHSVIIVSGSLNEKIWADDQILKIFHYLKDLGVKIFILTGNSLNIAKNGPLYKFLKDSIKENKLFFYYINEIPNAHFIIIE